LTLEKLRFVLLALRVGVVDTGVFCWVVAVLGALAIPVQPEMDRIAKSRRARQAAGIAFLAMERAGVMYFAMPLDLSFIPWLLIAAIVNCGTRRNYCPKGYL
jgi:bacteriorhodopsin